MDGRGRQRGSKDLPSEQRLRHQTERDVHAFAVEVIAPTTDLVVLQPLVERKDIEEEKQREENAVDESRRALGRSRRGEVDADGNPRNDASKTANAKGPPSAAGSFESFLQPAKANHRGVHAYETNQRGDVVNARELRDQKNHDGRTNGVLGPAIGITRQRELVGVFIPQWTGHQEVGNGRQEQKGCHRPGGANREEHLDFARRGARWARHEASFYGQGESVRERQDDDALHGVDNRGNEVVPAKWLHVGNGIGHHQKDRAFKKDSKFRMNEGTGLSQCLFQVAD